LQKLKDDQLFVIKEKNDQLAELLSNLKQEEELFAPDEHPMEKPEQILEVDES